MNNKSVEEADRILEVLDRLEKLERVPPMSKAIIPWEYLRSQTSFGLGADMRAEFFSRLQILEQKRMVELLRSCTDCGVSFTPKGRERLMMTEEEYQKRNRSVNQFVNTFNAPVGQFAQTTAPHSPIQQNQKALDLGIVSLVDRLVSEIKNRPELPPDTESEAEQLRIEVKKAHPIRERIVGYLNSLRLLAVGVDSVKQIIDEINRLIH